MQANGLLIPPQVDLTLSGRLPGEPEGRVLPCAIVEGLAAEVRLVGPLRNIAGVLVVPHGQVSAITLVARRPVEPEPVLFNRPAKGAIEVPEFLKLCGSAQSGGLQLLRVVTCLRCGARSVGEDGAMELVASDLRTDIEDGSAGRRFSHAAQNGHVHFLGIADVRNVAGYAEALETG